MRAHAATGRARRGFDLFVMLLAAMFSHFVEASAAKLTVHALPDRIDVRLLASASSDGDSLSASTVLLRPSQPPRNHIFIGNRPPAQLPAATHFHWSLFLLLLLLLLLSAAGACWRWRRRKVRGVHVALSSGAELQAMEEREPFHATTSLLPSARRVELLAAGQQYVPGLNGLAQPSGQMEALRNDNGNGNGIGAGAGAGTGGDVLAAGSTNDQLAYEQTIPLIVGEVIGCGATGEVRHCGWGGREVAMKCFYAFMRVHVGGPCGEEFTASATSHAPHHADSGANSPPDGHADDSHADDCINGYSLVCFKREVDILSCCRHPCICSMLGCCMYGGGPAILLELQPGGCLERLRAHATSAGVGSWRTIDQDVLDLCGLQTATLQLRFAVEIMSGLAYLHSHGILHRDVKTVRSPGDRPDGPLLTDERPRKEPWYYLPSLIDPDRTRGIILDS